MTEYGLTLSNRGVVTGAARFDDMMALARAADAEPLWGSLWVGDSIIAKPRLDAIALLGALAAQTERLRLGPACFASTPLRPALQLAYQWACLDLMSNGRTIFCACQGQREAGGGAFAQEFAALGIEPASRMRRMEEAVEIMRLTSSVENASYHGEYNHFDNVTIEPRPVQQPLPIWITSNPRPDARKLRERGLRRVARLGDGWMTTFQAPDVVREYLGDIRRYAAEDGRALPDDFEVAIYYNINVNDDVDAAYDEAHRYLRAYYGVDYPRPALEAWVAGGPPKRCIDQIRRYVDAGATTITLRLVTYDQQKQYDRVVSEVLPALVE